MKLLGDFYCEASKGILLSFNCHFKSFNLKELCDLYCETVGGLLL